VPRLDPSRFSEGARMEAQVGSRLNRTTKGKTLEGSIACIYPYKRKWVGSSKGRSSLETNRKNR